MSVVDTDDRMSDTRISYDTVAEIYAGHLREALDESPYIRAALALFAEKVAVAGGGPAVEVSCGPGHVTAHLRELGLDAFGIDLSPAMINVARREHPGLRFEVASMADLDLADAIAGLLAFRSLIHIPDDALPELFGHFRRALRPGGALLLGFPVGNTPRSNTSKGGHEKADIHRRQPARVAAELRDAGFAVEAHMLLDPDESNPGAFLFARRQSSDGNKLVS